MSEMLAKLSGFPVIVRPLEDCPSRLRNPCFEGNSAGDNTQTRSGASTQPIESTQMTDFTQTDAAPASDKADAAERRPDGNGDQGQSLPPPPSAALRGATPTEIIHKTDVTLRFSKNSQDHGNFVEVITAIKLYPPNAKKPQGPSFMIDRLSEPFIHGHVHLEFSSDEETKIDSVFRSVGFFAKSPRYLRTERLDKDPGQVRLEESLVSFSSLKAAEIWRVERL